MDTARLRTRSTGLTLHRAKQPTNPAAGPYGHPFHPILVTVPIGPGWQA